MYKSINVFTKMPNLPENKSYEETISKNSNTEMPECTVFKISKEFEIKTSGCDVDLYHSPVSATHTKSYFHPIPSPFSNFHREIV